MLLKNSVLLDLSFMLEEISDCYYDQGYNVAFGGLPPSTGKRFYAILLIAMVSSVIRQHFLPWFFARLSNLAPQHLSRCHSTFFDARFNVKTASLAEANMSATW